METHSSNHARSRVGRWVFWGFAAVAAYFLWTEHSAHLAGILPYLLLAACPLMHLFHHHGHGHHHGGADARSDESHTDPRSSAGRTDETQS